MKNFLLFMFAIINISVNYTCFVENYYIADTPGFSSLDLDNISGIGNKSVYTNDVTSSYDSNKAKIERLEARKKIYQDELDGFNKDLENFDDIKKELNSAVAKLNSLKKN